MQGKMLLVDCISEFSCSTAANKCLIQELAIQARIKHPVKELGVPHG